MHDRRKGPTTGQLSVDERGMRPLLVVTTTCCGARIWAKTGLGICPVCDRVLEHVAAPVKERDLTHLRHHTTRYWS